jgi:hypothetical protein
MDRSIYQGSPADLTQLVDTLSSAFQCDPALSWILPDPALRRSRLPKLFDIVVRSDLAAGLVLRSESCEAVTLWRAPGKAHIGLMETLLSGLGYLQTFGAALGRGLRSRTQWNHITPKASPIGTSTMPVCVPSIKAKVGALLPSAKD